MGDFIVSSIVITGAKWKSGPKPTQRTSYQVTWTELSLVHTITTSVAITSDNASDVDVYDYGNGDGYAAAADDDEDKRLMFAYITSVECKLNENIQKTTLGFPPRVPSSMVLAQYGVQNSMDARWW